MSNQTMQWIHPKEKLPPLGQDVMICVQDRHGNQDISIGQLRGESEWMLEAWYTKMLPLMVTEFGMQKELTYEKLRPNWGVAFWMHFPFRPSTSNVSEGSKSFSTYRMEYEIEN